MRIAPASSSFVRNQIASIWWTICEDDPRAALMRQTPHTKIWLHFGYKKRAGKTDRCDSMPCRTSDIDLGEYTEKAGVGGSTPSLATMF